MSAVADPFDARRAVGAAGLLRAFNDAGVLSAADVHVAMRLGALAGEEDDAVRLAIALAVRGPRLGHVFVDLATIRDSATVESDEPVDLSALPWPAPDDWTSAVRASALVALGEEDADGGEPAPLRLLGSRLYLDRYWREERAVADDLNELTARRAARGDRRRPGHREDHESRPHGCRFDGAGRSARLAAAARRPCSAHGQGGNTAPRGSARGERAAEQSQGLDAAQAARMASGEPQPLRARSSESATP